MPTAVVGHSNTWSQKDTEVTRNALVPERKSFRCLKVVESLSFGVLKNSDLKSRTICNLREQHKETVFGLFIIDVLNTISCAKINQLAFSIILVRSVCGFLGENCGKALFSEFSVR